MMKKAFIKRAALIFTILFCAANIFSQEEEQNLGSLSEALTIKVLTGEFKQEKKLASTEKIYVSNGKFLISKDAVYLHVLSPIENKIAFSKEKAKPGMDVAFEMMASILSGNVSFIEKGFTYVKEEDDVYDWSYRFYAKNERMRSIIDYIQVKGARVIEYACIVQKDGGWQQYTFFNQHLKEALSDEDKEYFK